MQQSSASTVDHLTRLFDRARYGDRHVGVFVISIASPHDGRAEPSDDDTTDTRAKLVIERLLRPNDLVIEIAHHELAVLASFDADNSPDALYETGLAFARRLAIRSGVGAGFTTAVGGVLTPRGDGSSSASATDGPIVERLATTARRLAATAAEHGSRVVVIVDGDGVEPIGQALDRSIERNELRLHLQPVISMHDGRRRGFEALLRWQRPGHGLLAPDAFLDAAAATSLLVPIGGWVIEHATRLLARLTRAGVIGEDESIGVNVVAAQLRSPDFATGIRTTLDRHGVDPARLTLEITEQSLLDADGVTPTILNELAGLGTPLAIDDFGTGYSSLELLRRLPAQIIKIDQGFVASLGRAPDLRDPASARDPAIVRAIIGLAHDLGMTAVAEGIDQRAQALWLREHRCDLGQGWFVGLPTPVSGISARPA